MGSENKVALITGASSGIGAGVSVELARRGYRVALLARRTDRLRTIQSEIEKAGGEALALEGDVCQPESLEQAVKATRERWGRIDVAVANAGFAVAGPLSRLTPADYRRQFETNVFGVLNTIYATRGSLIETEGIFSIIGSVAGHIALPLMTPYAMSKFAVRALAEGLRSEMKRKKVAVVLVTPGFIATEIDQVGNDGKSQDRPMTALSSRLRVPLERVLPQIVTGILSRKKEVTVTKHGKLILGLNRFAPSLLRALVERMP